MIEPAWLKIARRSLGTRELPGAPTAPRIARWLAALGAWWRNDETPWCGVALGAWVREAGLEIPQHYYRARAWMDWGQPLFLPQLGCVVVLERVGGGHVGLVAGVDRAGRLMVLGGNQGNRVRESSFPLSQYKVKAMRWPNDR